MALRRTMTERTFIILAQEAMEGLQLNDAKETYKSLRTKRNRMWSSFGEIEKVLSNKVILNEEIEDLEEEIDDNPDDESLKTELDRLLSSQSTINLIGDLENGFNQKHQSFGKIGRCTIKMNKYKYNKTRQKDKYQNKDENETNDDIATYQSVVYGNDQMVFAKNKGKYQYNDKHQNKDKNKPNDDIATYQSVVYGNNQMVLAKNRKIQKAKRSKSQKIKKKRNKTKERERETMTDDSDEHEPIEVHTFKIQKIWSDLYVPDPPKSKKKSFIRTRGESDCLILKNKKKKRKKKSKKGGGRSRRTQSVISAKKYGRNMIDKYSANTAKKNLQSELLSEICQSLQFGAVSVRRINKKTSKSDKLSFWFNVSFHINHREKYLVYFYYSRDEYIKQKKSHFMPIKTRKSRICCDLESAQKNAIINHGNNDIALPKNVLIEIFKYAKPRKLLELYAYNMADDDNPFGNKHFVGSNLEWICNHFGIETVFIHKFLVKMLYFIYSPAIDQYIEMM